MVRLTVDLIARGTSGYTKKKRDESIQHYLKRLTHLYLEDRNIDEVGDDLSVCRNLTVLYLYDNKLCKIPNMAANVMLTHLYLQNNQISHIENLASCRRLQKLYLGGNSINVLEGFEKLDQLQELHIENQKLPAGEKLLFDPRSIATLASCLQVINVSGNNLDSVGELEVLGQLQQFHASDNHLSDMKEMARCLSSWRALWRLELIGNPLCHKSKYRDRVIIMAPTLEMLDGKEITETSKQFLRNWQANKEANKRKRSSMSRQITQGENDLPPVSVMPRSNIPGYMMPALPRKQFAEVLARSLSQPNSALHGRGLTGSPPKYLNTLGTFYNSTSASIGKRYSTALVNLGGDYSSGDMRNHQS